MLCHGGVVFDAKGDSAVASSLSETSIPLLSRPPGAIRHTEAPDATKERSWLHELRAYSWYGRHRQDGDG